VLKRILDLREGKQQGSTENYIVESFIICSLHIKSRRMRCAGCVARMGEVRNACEVSVGKREKKGPLGRRGRRWEFVLKLFLMI